MAIGAAVKEAYDEVLVPAGMDDVAIFTELGRFMLAPYGCLEMCIRDRKCPVSKNIKDKVRQKKSQSLQYSCDAKKHRC